MAAEESGLRTRGNTWGVLLHVAFMRGEEQFDLILLLFQMHLDIGLARFLTLFNYLTCGGTFDGAATRFVPSAGPRSIKAAALN